MIFKGWEFRIKTTKNLLLENLISNLQRIGLGLRAVM